MLDINYELVVSWGYHLGIHPNNGRGTRDFGLKMERETSMLSSRNSLSLSRASGMNLNLDLWFFLLFLCGVPNGSLRSEDLKNYWWFKNRLDRMWYVLMFDSERSWFDDLRRLWTCKLEIWISAARIQIWNFRVCSMVLANQIWFFIWIVRIINQFPQTTSLFLLRIRNGWSNSTKEP